MSSFLEKLRKKDRAKQESFTFFAAFTITLFISLIWLFTLVYDLKTDENDKNAASPFQAFSNQVKSILDGKESYSAEN